MSMSPPRTSNSPVPAVFHPMNQESAGSFKVRRAVHKKGLATKTAKNEMRVLNNMKASTIRVDAENNSLVFNPKCGICRITPGNTNTVFSVTTCTDNCIMCVTGEHGTSICSKRIYPTKGGVYLLPKCKKYVIYWKRLTRAHTPVFRASELDSVFLRAWSVSTSLMVQKRDSESYNGLVLGPNFIKCIDCNKRFKSYEAWASHFTTYRVPQTLPWYRVAVIDGSVTFTKSEIKLSAKAVPRPHNSDTERSLLDTKYSEPLIIKAIEKLERHIHTNNL